MTPRWRRAEDPPADSRRYVVIGGGLTSGYLDTDWYDRRRGGYWTQSTTRFWLDGLEMPQEGT